MWDALIRARADYAPRVLAAAEDAVFRWYLPLARAVAAGPAVDLVDPVVVEQAAELGLAQAVLGWRQRDCREFERFARAMISERVRLCIATPGTRRVDSGPPAPSPLPGRRATASPGATEPGSGS